MYPIPRALVITGLLIAAVLPLSGCAALPCDEFAAPPSRQLLACPTKTAEAPPTPTRYCYRSLASNECFAQPQPERSGFTGTYP